MCPAGLSFSQCCSDSCATSCSQAFGLLPLCSWDRHSMLPCRSCCSACVASLQNVQVMSALCLQHKAVPRLQRDLLTGHGDHWTVLELQRNRIRRKRQLVAECCHAFLLAAAADLHHLHAAFSEGKQQRSTGNSLLASWLPEQRPVEALGFSYVALFWGGFASSLECEVCPGGLRPAESMST